MKNCFVLVLFLSLFLTNQAKARLVLSMLIDWPMPERDARVSHVTLLSDIPDRSGESGIPLIRYPFNQVSLSYLLSRLAAEASCFFCLVIVLTVFFCFPEGRTWMSDVTLLSGVSELSFDSPFLSALFFFFFFPA